MYIPLSNRMDDEAEQLSFMQRFNFATIVSLDGSIPIATHLPFLVNATAESVVLQSHFAKANSHWELITEGENLVIFSEPHAYISPVHYTSKLNVPTWNYLAVHVYGKGQIIEDPSAVRTHLDNFIASHDPHFKVKWDQFPEEYKIGMAKGIAVFEITVSRIEGKKKISQNKTAEEKANIIAHLEKSDDVNERNIAAYMGGLADH